MYNTAEVIVLITLEEQAQCSHLEQFIVKNENIKILDY